MYESSSADRREVCERLHWRTTRSWRTTGKEVEQSHLSHHSLTIQYNAALLVTCHITVWQYNTMQHYLSPVTSQFHNTLQVNAVLHITCHITVSQYDTIQYYTPPVTSQFHNTIQYYLSPVTSQFYNWIQCSITCHSSTIGYNAALLEQYLSPVTPEFYNRIQITMQYYMSICHLLQQFHDVIQCSIT